MYKKHTIIYKLNNKQSKVTFRKDLLSWTYRISSLAAHSSGLLISALPKSWTVKTSPHKVQSCSRIKSYEKKKTNKQQNELIKLRIKKQLFNEQGG